MLESIFMTMVWNRDLSKVHRKRQGRRREMVLEMRLKESSLLYSQRILAKVNDGEAEK